MDAQLIRRIVAGLVVVGVLTLLGWLVATFVYNGSITIKGGDASLNVTITNTDSTVVIKAKDSQYRLAPGQYRVVATTDKAGTSRLVQVGPLSNTDVTIGQTALLHTNTALKSPLYGVIPHGKWFVGYDPTTQTMKRYDGAGNSSTKLSSPDTVGQEGEWETEIPEQVGAYQPYTRERAVVVGAGRLFVVAPGGVDEVSQEGIELKVSAFNTYALGANSNQESFAVGYDRSVYWYENAQAKPKKVYTNKKQFDQVAIGGDYAVLYSTALPNSKEDLRSSFDDHQVDPQVLNAKTGKAYTIGGPVSSVTISPDGKYATVKPRNQQPYLYDLADKKQVATIDQSDGAAPFWISPTTFIYETDRLVWRYDTRSQTSDELASVGSTITSFTTDGKGGYLATYYNGVTDCGIYNLSQTAAPDATNPVQLFLPYSNQNLSITYSNINGPTITISTYAILNRSSQLPQYRNITRQYRQSALDFLISKGVDLKKFTIVYDPADPL